MSLMKNSSIVLTPNLPFWDIIPTGIFIGGQIKITGKIPKKPYRFKINLSCRTNSSHPLHLSIRFPEKIVVRNTLQCYEWKSEERSGPFPFSVGEEFSLVILTECDGYYITVDDVHCWRYAHRLPYQTVKMLNVEGDVIIKRITYFNDQNQSHVMKYPFSCSPESSDNSDIILLHKFTSGLQDGLTIYMNAKPNDSAYGFTISLQCGISSSSNIAFNFDVRFFNKTIVRNTFIDGQWDNEETAVPYFPFKPAINFDIIIRVESNRYLVAINGIHFIAYEHHIYPLTAITTLVIKKDVNINSLNFR